MSGQLGLLGQIEFVDAEGSKRLLASSNQRRLMAVLGCSYRSPVSSETLADRLDLTAGGLRTRIRRIRQRIGIETIVTEGSGYRLGPISVDAEVFEQKRASVIHLNAHAQIEGLQAALAHWRGDALEEFAHEAWAAGEAARLDELRCVTFDDLADLLVSQHAYAEAVSMLEGRIGERPFRDKTRRQLMLALARDGRQAEAIRSYQAYRTFLIEETGTEPPDETKALELAIASGDTLPGPHAKIVVDLRSENRRTGLLTFVAIDLEPAAGNPTHDVAVATDLLELLEADHAHIVEASSTRAVVAYVDPRDGAHAASEMMQRLTPPASRRGSDLLVRIGIHTGTGYGEGGEFSPAAVRHVSEIVTAASHGQIIASSTTADLLAEHEAFSVLPRGRHRLGLHTDAVHLSEVLWPGRGPQQRLRTISDTPTNIPSVRPTLFGRDEDATEIAALLEKTRLLTLVGPGGAGKSALALEVASQQGNSYPEGVFLVDLAAVNDPTLLLDALAQPLKLRVDERNLEFLTSALDGRRLFLLLDNAEHLLDDVADLVEHLLSIEGPTILVTSRQWLDLPGEKTFYLPTLHRLAPSGRSYGAELFFKNALDAGIDIGTFSDDSVERLCDRLDHLPLALELAAGSSRRLPPDLIIESLDRGDHLESGRRRHRRRRFTSVEEMLEGSFELLDEHQRSLLITLGIFRGPMTFEAIEGIWNCPDGVDPVAVLQQLRASSLVQHLMDNSGDTHYRLLETVRDFALEIGRTSGQSDDLRRRHRDWFLQWSETTSALAIYASTRRAVLFETQLPNFREAMAYSESRGESLTLRRQAVLLTTVWQVLVRGDEGLRWLEASVSPSHPDNQDVSFLVSKFCAFLASDQWGSMVSLAPLLEEASRKAGTAPSILGLGLSAVMQAIDAQRSQQLFELARERDRQLHAGFEPVIDHLAGDVSLIIGNHSAAAEFSKRASSTLDGDEFGWIVSSALTTAGLATYVLGEKSEAHALVDQSIEVARTMPDSLGGITRGIVATAVIESASGAIATGAELLQREIERNNARASSTAVRAEPLIGVVHVALDAAQTELACQLMHLIENLDIVHRSPWQLFLHRQAQVRSPAAEVQAPGGPLSIDEALALSAVFLCEIQQASAPEADHVITR